MNTICGKCHKVYEPREQCVPDLWCAECYPDLEPKDEDLGGTPIHENPSYRESMRDAGRGGMVP